MVLVRRFEDTVQELFQRGEVHGTTHLYSPPLEDAFLPGAEAIASSVRERL
jgi:TPP-dependent pyruvate/acetoin dehydrogenase alpha subunit